MEAKHFDDLKLKEKIERWDHVVMVLKKLTPHQRRKHWNMSTWGEKTACGTIACAAGHCGLNSWFRRRGFKLDFNHVKWIDSLGLSQDYWNESLSTDPSDFFGNQGTSRIFYNDDPRPVSKVIRECETYIKELKANG